MWYLTAANLAALSESLKDRHHPNFEAATEVLTGIRWTFKPFTAADPRPELPRGTWLDSSLTHDQQSFLNHEFSAAANEWDKAAAIRRLKEVAASADPVWSSYIAARHGMEGAFENLKRTEDGYWRSAISRLLAAQDRAAKAAEVWDSYAWTIASAIADAEECFVPGPGDFERAGVQPMWVIDKVETYVESPTCEHPLQRKVAQDIGAQRAHVRTIAELVGDKPLEN